MAGQGEGARPRVGPAWLAKYIVWLYRSTMTTTIPLLHDNHNHVSLYAAFSSCIDISRSAPDAALALLRGLPEDRLSVVRGWKSFELPMTSEELSSLPPIILINFSLHGFVVSDSGVPFLETTVPEVASMRNDQAWCEANVPPIFAAYCGLAGLDAKKLGEYIDRMLPLGIGSSDEMTVPTIQALDVCSSSPYDKRLNYWVAPALYEKMDIARRGLVSGIKLFLDGAVGSRSAAIEGPWIGPGKAMFTYADDVLLAILRRAGAYGTGLSAHAIGELAIEQALSAIEVAVREGARFRTIRLEHVQYIDVNQARRAKDLGIVLSMQPNFTSDSIDYTDRLTESYLKRNNPFRMLIDEVGFEPGRDMLFGSDGMPDGIAYAATQALFPAYPSQRLSLDELVAGYGTVTLDIDDTERRVSVSGTSPVRLAP